MATKKDEDQDLDEPDKQDFKIEKSDVILGLAFLVIAQLFFYLLSVKTGLPFGTKEIFFGAIVAIVITLFLMWTTFMMSLNRYLGAIIALFGIGAVIYGLRTQFQGIYTNIFTVISLVVAVGYLVLHFRKFTQN